MLLLFFLLSELVLGCFDTSGSIIPLSVSEIHWTCGFCDEQHDEQELGIQVIGLWRCLFLTPDSTTLCAGADHSATLLTGAGQSATLWTGKWNGDKKCGFVCLPACLKKALMSVPAPLCFMHSVWSNNVWSQINILSPTKSAVSSAAVAIYKGLSQCLSLSFWQLGGMLFKSCRQLLQMLSPPFHWVLNWVPPGFLSV